MSDSLRTLTVTVLEAKDVIACDKGKSSDPFCKLDLVDGKSAKAISGEVRFEEGGWEETIIILKVILNVTTSDLTPSPLPLGI